MPISLYAHQIQALYKMHNGCIVCGGTGSGKSITSLGYYYMRNGGDINTLCGSITHMKMLHPKDLYIITTARKRDTLEWEGELAPFHLSTTQKTNGYKNKVVVDSWNNIGKYKEVTDAFFIFDEQRVVGSGAWVKAFLKICKSNEWILLSATPGDTWTDYIPVFIANGFYKNRTEFIRKHVVYSRFSKFPKIDRYIETGRLIRLRKNVLVDMPFDRKTKPIHEDVYANYNISTYKDIMKNRWNPWKKEPIKNASELCYCLRRVVNSSESRQTALLEIFEDHPRLIIFYNFDYELELLKDIAYATVAEVAEYNGHKHQPVPESNEWMYLVQYNSGAEAWNCIKTDTIVFFSQNYSYKIMAQASGRIDRLNTPYENLYYYHIKSRSGIDLAISRALKSKKRFNESSWVNTH